LFCNKPDPDEGKYIEYLVDGNYTNFFHFSPTSWVELTGVAWNVYSPSFANIPSISIVSQKIPSAISNLTATPLEGGVLLEWEVPVDSNLFYVQIDCTRIMPISMKKVSVITIHQILYILSFIRIRFITKQQFKIQTYYRNGKYGQCPVEITVLGSNDGEQWNKIASGR